MDSDNILGRLDTMITELTECVSTLSPIIDSKIPEGAKICFASALLRTTLLYEGLEAILAVVGQPLSGYDEYDEPPDYSGRIAPSWPESLGHLAYFQAFQYEYPEHYEEYDDFEFNSLFCQAAIGLIKASKDNRVRVQHDQASKSAMQQPNDLISLTPAEALDVATTLLRSLPVARKIWEHENRMQNDEHMSMAEYHLILAEEEEAMERLIEADQKAWEEHQNDWNESERLRRHDSGYDDESYWEQENYIDWDKE